MKPPKFPLRCFPLYLQLMQAGFGLLRGLGECYRQNRRVGAQPFDVLHHRALNVVGVDGFRGAFRPPSLLGCLADVISVTLAVLFICAGVRHPCAARRAVDQPLEQRAVLVADEGAAVEAVAPQNCLDLLPGLHVHNGFVLAFVGGSLEHYLARVDGIGQQSKERALVERLPAALLALAGYPPLVVPASALKLLRREEKRLQFQVKLEDRPDPRGLLGVDFQAAAALGHVVAQDRHAADPFAFSARGPHLVLGPLGDDLAFELGEGEQDVQGQSAHGVGGVELLGDRDEAHAVAIEDFHKAREVEQGAAEAVHFVDHDAINAAGLDVRHESLERGALQVAAGEAAVIVSIRQACPALVALTRNIGLGRFPLSVQGVELLLQSLVGGLAGINGAADCT